MRETASFQVPVGEGLRMHVQRIGKANSGFPLFCLHGFSESGDTWEALTVKGYTLYAPDILGHGRSDKPDEPKYYRLPDIIQQLEGVIHTVMEMEYGQTDDRSYGILGYSMGGRLGLAYTLAHPTEVKALLLESGGIGIEDSDARQARLVKDTELAQAILEKGSDWFAEKWAQVPIFATQRQMPLDKQEVLRKRRAANAPHALARTLLGTGQGVYPYMGNQLFNWQGPLLYIAGAMDEKYSKVGQYMARQYGFSEGKGRLVIVPKAGHNVHWEQPEVFRTIVEKFLYDYAIG